MKSYGGFPLIFERNQRLTDERVKFLARGRGYALFLTPTEVVLSLANPEPRPGAEKSATLGLHNRQKSNTAVLRMQLVGANPHPAITGLDQLPGKVNYFIGNDPKRWRTNIPTYTKVKYEEIYPGVDLVYYGNQRQLEYDFVVAPGAAPKAITLSFEGADKLEVDAHGDLVLQAAGAEIRLRKPVIYQEVGSTRQEITGGYVLKGEHQVSFQVGHYDATRRLVIDPILSYSTYVGGSDADEGRGIAVDASGNAYVVGQTQSSNFPTFPTTSPLPFDPSFNGGSSDAFVAKLNSTGTALVYSTFLGGSGFEFADGIAVDASGNAYVVGETGSTDFPTTPGAFDDSFNGGTDAFVAKLNSTGTALLYSTFLGGGTVDKGHSIAVDGSGNAYVTGETGSTDFP
ncbi:MAG: SBBP repeat-containing protein, partial [Candidatus Rokubacteria bacterium]|nr:SBBP repeat-containing protein [Candidatus Rokubacteria bacterium]